MAPNVYGIDKSLEHIRDHIDEAITGINSVEYDDEGDLTEDVAVPVVLALSELVALANELREAGAEIAEIPAEDEALVTAVVNGALIQKHIEAEVAHLEGVIKQFEAKR